MIESSSDFFYSKIQSYFFILKLLEFKKKVCFDLMNGFLNTIIGICFFFSLWGCQSSPSGEFVKTKYVGGIQIHESDQEEWARTLKAAGMNMAQVTAYAKQGKWNSDHLWWEYEDTTHVLKEIRAIKGEGLKVMMVLRVALQDEYEGNAFKWHGMIFPKGRKQKEEWFRRYQYFTEMWAKLCEREGVEVLAVGSELNALLASNRIKSRPSLIEYFSNIPRQRMHMNRILKYQDQLKAEDLWVSGNGNYENHEEYISDKIESQKAWADEVCHHYTSDYLDQMNQDRSFLDSTWRRIINQTRKHFSGTLSMAANFDNYQEISFWDALDCMGINAYFPLRSFPGALSEVEMKASLETAWSNVFKDISQFKQKNALKNMPLFFTEIGYTQKADCTIEPWKGHGFSLITKGLSDSLIIWKRAPDRPNERVLAIQSLYDVCKREAQPLLGICYWKMSSNPMHSHYEPFMMLVDQEEKDKLQSALSQFLSD